MEFDQIREYVPGDDPRTINWQATARRGGLHVNQYQDERSQPVYAVIDMGRTMEAPFEGMTLLDHAINAALVVLNTALLKNDRAGLVTFGTGVETVVRAERRPAHIYRILDALYKQETSFREPNFEALYATVRQHVHGRGLLLLFTNFETRAGLERQLPYLRALARSHLVVVVFFENTGLQRAAHRAGEDDGGPLHKDGRRETRLGEARDRPRAQPPRGAGAPHDTRRADGGHDQSLPRNQGARPALARLTKPNVSLRVTGGTRPAGSAAISRF